MNLYSNKLNEISFTVNMISVVSEDKEQMSTAFSEELRAKTSIKSSNLDLILKIGLCQIYN